MLPAEKQGFEARVQRVDLADQIALFLRREDERSGWRRGAVMQGTDHHEIGDTPADGFGPNPDPVPVGGVPAIDRSSPLHSETPSPDPPGSVGSVRSRNPTLRSAAFQPSSSPRSASSIRSTSHSIRTAVSMRSRRAAIAKDLSGASARRMT